MDQQQQLDPEEEKAREQSEKEKTLDAGKQKRDQQNVSTKKIEANRRNALKSTGPKTAAGKKVVSQNAITHGFFSKGLLIRHADGNESQGEFDDWYSRICEHFHPDGFSEHYWVEKIAVYSWRLRRVMRFESGQIAESIGENRGELQSAVCDNSDGPGCSTENSKLESPIDHWCLPPRQFADIILRYEPMLNKQLNHAFAELERLQRHRKGEFV